MNIPLVEAVKDCFFDIMNFKETDNLIKTEVCYDKHYHDFFIRFTNGYDFIIYMGVNLDNNAGHKSMVHINVNNELGLFNDIETSNLVATLNNSELKKYIIKFSKGVKK